MPATESAGTLLRDRRLVTARGHWVTSFMSGSVALFLSYYDWFPGSSVMAEVPPETAEQFTALLAAAIGTSRQWQVLYRATRDGGTAEDFHRLCDRQGPTLTLIRDTRGCVFGGYTSAEWGVYIPTSTDVYTLAYTQMDATAFLFTVLNPHNDAPALFPSHGGMCPAVCCDPCLAPAFCGLYLEGKFVNAQRPMFPGSWSAVDEGFVNTTRHSGQTVLTGEAHFTPVEVEVWGYADWEVPAPDVLLPDYAVKAQPSKPPPIMRKKPAPARRRTRH